MKAKDDAMQDPSSNETEPTESMPDSIDRELAEPLGFDLSAFEVEEPSPESVEGVVEAMARALTQPHSEPKLPGEAHPAPEEEAQPPAASAGRTGREHRGRVPPVKDMPDPYRTTALPSERRAPAAQRR